MMQRTPSQAASGPVSPGAQHPVDLRRRRAIAALVSTGVFIASLDLFIVNIAFPDIAKAFPGSHLGSLTWVLNAYAIVFAAALVPAGRWFDRVGRRRGFLLGLAVFGVASAVCAVAPSLNVLIGARVLQALGAAALLPTSLGLLLPEYAPEERPKAIALWSAVGGVAAAAGPPIGGLLVELSWHWVFLVNVPVVIVALVVGQRLLTERRDEADTSRPDVIGALALAAAVAALVWSLVEAPDHGWTGARTVGGALAAVVLGLAFVLRSRRHPSPVVPGVVVAHRAFAMATLSSLAFFVAFGAMLLGGVLLLSEVWGQSTLMAGLGLAPGPATAALLASRGAVLVQRFGPRVVAVSGALLFSVGGAMLALRITGDRGDYLTRVLPGMLVSGAGVGLVLPSTAGAAFGGLPPQLLSTGIAVFSVARQVGVALGVAVLIAVYGQAEHLTVSASQDGYLVQVGAGLLAAVLALGIPRAERVVPDSRA